METGGVKRSAEGFEGLELATSTSFSENQSLGSWITIGSESQQHQWVILEVDKRNVLLKPGTSVRFVILELPHMEHENAVYYIRSGRRIVTHQHEAKKCIKIQWSSGSNQRKNCSHCIFHTYCNTHNPVIHSSAICCVRVIWPRKQQWYSLSKSNINM